MSVCTSYCDKCAFRKIFHTVYRYCDYLCMTNERRPCPAGDGCTVRVSREVWRKRQLTEAEKAERAAKNKEKCRDYYQRNKEKILEKNRKWQQENKAYMAQYARERRKKKREEKLNGCEA